MNAFSTTGAAKADSNRNFFYGHSPLRYLNDGKDVVPGLVESWESNDDASEWTLPLPQGPEVVRRPARGRRRTSCSGGKTSSWTRQWPSRAPDEARSGKGTLAKLKAVDDVTLTMTFDAPAPLTADRMAMWVNGNIGEERPDLDHAEPLRQAVPPEVRQERPGRLGRCGRSDGDARPTGSATRTARRMTGFKCKSFDNNKGVVLERNPYY